MKHPAGGWPADKPGNQEEVGMYSLEKAVEQVSRWPSGKDKERARLAGLVDDMIRRCQEAKKVWEGYLASPGAPGTSFALLSWVGPARARQLHEINLAARAALLKVTADAGPGAGRFANLDEDVIEMAYRQLEPGETGPDAARKAVSRLDEQVSYLGSLRKRLLTAKGKTASAAKTAAPKKAAPARKPAGKKKATPAKKPAKKKAAKKKRK
jgi:hypothetical protein